MTFSAGCGGRSRVEEMFYAVLTMVRLYLVSAMALVVLARSARKERQAALYLVRAAFRWFTESEVTGHPEIRQSMCRTSLYMRVAGLFDHNRRHRLIVLRRA